MREGEKVREEEKEGMTGGPGWWERKRKERERGLSAGLERRLGWAEERKGRGPTGSLQFPAFNHLLNESKRKAMK